MKMYSALREGRLEEGRQWQHLLSPLIRALYAEPNPSVIKAVLAHQGLVPTVSRAPHLVATDVASMTATHVLGSIQSQAAHLGGER